RQLRVLLPEGVDLRVGVVSENRARLVVIEVAEIRNRLLVPVVAVEGIVADDRPVDSLLTDLLNGNRTSRRVGAELDHVWSPRQTLDASDLRCNRGVGVLERVGADDRPTELLPARLERVALGAIRVGGVVEQ